MTTSLSVVMPIGRVDPHLEEALASVLAQRADGPFEVVLSLNTRDESSQAWLHRLTGCHAKAPVRIVDSSDRRGAAHARNVGARAACGELIAFCDSDDVTEPGWLAALARSLASFDAVSGRVSDERFVPLDDGKWRSDASSAELPTYLGVPYLLSGNLGIKRAAFDAVGGFDVTLTRCEDIALSWELLRRGYTLGFTPDALVHYRPRVGLVPTLTQHFHYGRGMSEVLVRYGVPGDEPGGHRTLLRANGQRPPKRTVVTALRRTSTAAGRAVGLVTEGTHSVTGRGARRQR